MSPWGEITKKSFGEQKKRSQVEEKWALTIPELLEASFTKPPGWVAEAWNRPVPVPAGRPPASPAHNSGGALKYGL